MSSNVFSIMEENFFGETKTILKKISSATEKAEVEETKRFYEIAKNLFGGFGPLLGINKEIYRVGSKKKPLVPVKVAAPTEDLLCCIYYGANEEEGDVLYLDVDYLNALASSNEAFSVNKPCTCLPNLQSGLTIISKGGKTQLNVVASVLLQANVFGDCIICRTENGVLKGLANYDVKAFSPRRRR